MTWWIVAKNGAPKQNNRISGKDAAPIEQPLSAKKFVVYSFAFLFTGIVFTWFYLVWAPNHRGEEIDCRIYFPILIVWGLLCASFLTGVMRGYASISHRSPPLAVMVTGPVAVFLLVIGLGAKFAQCAPSTFDLTVRPYAADGKASLIKSGTIVLDLDNDRRQEDIGTNGEANFKGIPGRLSGSVIAVLPRVPGYKENWQKLKLTGHVLDVRLEPEENQQPKVADPFQKLMDSEAELVLSNFRDETAAARYGDLFTTTATISDSGPPAHTWHGREEIMLRFRKLERFADLRHKLAAPPSTSSNGVVTVEAITEFLMENRTQNQNPNGSGKERWTFVKEGEQWKIQSFRYNVP